MFVSLASQCNVMWPFMQMVHGRRAHRAIKSRTQTTRSPVIKLDVQKPDHPMKATAQHAPLALQRAAVQLAWLWQARCAPATVAVRCVRDKMCVCVTRVITAEKSEVPSCHSMPGAMCVDHTPFTLTVDDLTSWRRTDAYK